jgi:hypothetical protein
LLPDDSGTGKTDPRIGLGVAACELSRQLTRCG